MPEFFYHTFYGNTVQGWLFAFLIILLAIMLGRTLYWVFSKVVRALTAKTKTRIDDILIDMFEEPFVFALVLAGTWFGLSTLVLPEKLEEIVGHTFQFLIIMMIGWLVNRLLDAIYKEYLVPFTEGTENDLDDQLLPIVRKGSRTIVWCMAVIVGLNNAGYDVAALIAGLGIGGLALAMAAKDTVANIFGGFTIFTDQPFKMRDRVRIDGYDGTIEEIGIRSTRLRTLDGTLVTIPNSRFSDSAVENVTLEPTRKIILDLGLTYDTTPENMDRAMAILDTISQGNENIGEGTKIYFSAFGDFAMTIRFIYYINKGADIAGTQSEVNLAILRQFNEAGLEFAFPTQTVYTVGAN